VLPLAGFEMGHGQGETTRELFVITSELVESLISLFKKPNLDDHCPQKHPFPPKFQQIALWSISHAFF
jgi:hypothetical protein